jgi:hypothetical protein
MTLIDAVYRGKRRLDARVFMQIAKHDYNKVKRAVARPFAAQDAAFDYLVFRAKDTRFGREHDFHSIACYKDFKLRVPLRDYEALHPYINAIIAGESDVLWPGRPIAFAYTSGTTSRAKYIPITPDFLLPYRLSARKAVCMYIAETGNAWCMLGRLLYFTHDIEIERLRGLPVRPIAGIAKAHAPYFFRKRFLPSDRTNRMQSFEESIEMSVNETVHEDVTLISGIAPWIQLYFNKLIERTGRPIKDVFPNFSVLINGGVNTDPYITNLSKSIGKAVDTIELYPSSEGFIGFRYSQNEPGLVLNLSMNVFYEFVPLSEVFSANPTRVSLRDVEMGVDYAVVLNTNSGLWGYNLGDVIRFISKNPHRFLMVGRTAHFISTTGEHLIAENVESALADISEKVDIRITELTVAPQIHPRSGLPYHEWFIEFEKEPTNMEDFTARLNTLVGRKNINYEEFCEAKIILPLQVRVVARGGFIQYMKSIGKLGGQNKVPRLSNDRKIADAMMKYVVPSPESGN